ncbi:helix-turn-helix domain-containing protein [Aureibacter tunicatorum]|uniref:AraC-like DNA-binding protein n=1 Tax=Aureibacter tunicatorum TaxID=866807 RepID=A0AAE3XNV6_9BACT|nr:helix-turn-helix transcriptional regulator [Aureibacter tunicatorum]MDR6239325.1 AraC-like DNA-binding protein [Aureibacter tunicatorum]BDD04752.1 AraC family transcriptional regulator [Aureibacter tunicatorum]
MTTRNQNITFFRSNEIGEGLPYSVTKFNDIDDNNDIFIPSLRDFHVIFYVKKGSGTYHIDFKKYSFQANTFILISKQQLHHFSPFAPNDVELLSITFSPDFIYRNETDLNHLFQFISSDHILGKQILRIPETYHDDINAIFESMHKVYQSDDLNYKFKAFYHWLCIMLIHIEQIQLSQTLNQTNEETNDSHTQIIKLMELIEAHYKSEFKVEFYAESMFLTLKALSKICKDYYKTSPKALINERRILEIKRLLRGTDRSVKSIAFELNFDEPTNMFKFFKKHVGITPNEFRSSTT